jgi:drug/metabolite transporter superfamily protein YnfA
MPPPTSWTPATVAASLALFLAAALTEVGGGWLVWQGVVAPRRHHAPAWICGGVLLLVAYGFIPTAQPLVAPTGGAPFGRVYAVYGGVFILMSYGWGWVLDGVRPDRGDGLGAGIALVGVGVAWFWRRRGGAGEG